MISYKFTLYIYIYDIYNKNILPFKTTKKSFGTK